MSRMESGFESFKPADSYQKEREPDQFSDPASLDFEKNLDDSDNQVDPPGLHDNGVSDQTVLTLGEVAVSRAEETDRQSDSNSPKIETDIARVALGGPFDRSDGTRQ